MSPLSHRVTNLEAEAERRWEQRTAERLAAIEGVPVAAVLGWLVESRAERAEAAQVFSGRGVDVRELTRYLAELHELTAEETEQAVSEAERCLEQLREQRL